MSAYEFYLELLVLYLSVAQQHSTMVYCGIMPKIGHLQFMINKRPDCFNKSCMLIDTT